MAGKRKDSKGRVLKEGEYQRANGTYEYRWRSEHGGKRQCLYAKTLDELRTKEANVTRDISEGIRTDGKKATVNDFYELWLKLKKGLKDNTFSSYRYLYEQYIFPEIGKNKICQTRRSDVRAFYNYLADELNLKITTVDRIHCVLRQVLDLAVDDDYLRKNPSDGAIKDLMQSRNHDREHRRALTLAEQHRLINFLQHNEQYNHWLPIITVMIECGFRVGEVTGLQWADVDLESGFIDISRTLVYYKHRCNGDNECRYEINTPKTVSSRRMVPMTNAVKDAFLAERDNQQKNNIVCNANIDNLTDFVFLNRYGYPLNHNVLNKAICRIIRDCNDEELSALESGKIKEKDMVLLPRFSCHCLRHTCATRLCEAGVNVKVIQDILGHSDISTTMNIYTDATKEFKVQEINRFNEFLRASSDNGAE